jgi:hypothetical protein
MTSVFDPVDIYCERTDIGLWNEPLNALTNISFFIAAWLLYRAYKTAGVRDREAVGLIACVALVGLGSLLFHTFANPLAEWADIVPIGAFVYFYLWLALRRLLGLNRIKAAANLIIFTLLVVLTDYIPVGFRLNGSITYLPCLIAILSIATHLRRRSLEAAATIWDAGLVFALSLTFRSIDMMLCEYLPLGTHFFWHIINGIVLYKLTFAVLKSPVNAAN